MKKTLFLSVFITSLFGLLLIFGRQPLTAQENDGQQPDDNSGLTEFMQRFLEDQEGPTEFESILAVTPCVGGMAGSFPCNNVDLFAHLSLTDLGATAGNDSWGWTDPLDGKEYAIMGVNNGTAFVDISDPENPVYLGKLPTHTSNSSWRDIKVYANYAFVVSEAGSHGMQVFDLTRLRNVVGPPVTFTEDDHYSQFGNAHNLVINEDTGYAYAVGTSTCAGGLHMVNIQDPLNPTNAGCFSSDGYTHDAQCVIYTGPDTAYQGHEICFNSNEDSVTIVDVTNKAAPAQLFRFTYSGTGYTHQGWLTEDQRYFIFDDELDEQSFGHNTRTRVINVTDLNAPTFVGFYDGPVAAIDHNLYTKGDYAFEANYRSGLRIVNIDNVATANLSEVAYFDTYPTSNSASFSGAWNTYPYFDSGAIIISDINSGLFIVKPWYMVALSAAETSLAALPGETVTYTVDIHNTGTHTDTYMLSTSGNTWNTAVSTNSILLTAGQSSTFDVVVTIPPTPATNMDDVTITAVSQSDSAIQDSLSLQTTAIIYDVGMSTPDTSLDGSPGTTVTYTLYLTNTGNVSDAYDLGITGNVWQTTLSQDVVLLDAGQSAVILAGVEIPTTALPGAMDTMAVTAVSQANSAVSAELDLATTANAVYGLATSTIITEQSGLPGMTLTFSLQLTNTGNTTDTYDVQAGSNWSVQTIPVSVTLASGANSTANIAVTIPLSATANSSDVITVTVTSQGDDNVYQTLLFTAVALESPGNIIYLPIILKP